MSVKGVIRSVKNVAKGYSDIQIRTRAATSNDPAGPTQSQMIEISQATYNNRDFMEVMEIIDKRLNDNGKQWRHVYKALILLHFLVEAGSDSVIAYAKENLYIIKTLKEFQFIDEDGKDQGLHVRLKSKELTALLNDESKLRELRQNNRHALGSGMGGAIGGPVGSRLSNDYYNEDAELQRAINESKRLAQSQSDSRSNISRSTSDEDLRKAIELSKQEELRRQNSQKPSDTIDFFSVAEEPQQPTFDFNAAVNAAAMQQQLLAQQQDAQQQELLRLQQQQALELQMQQEMYLKQQALLLQQQQQQQLASANPFGSQQQQPQPLDGRLSDLQKNNAQLDPFASIAVRNPITAQPTGSSVVKSASTAFNPFGASSVAPSAVNSDPFGSIGGNTAYSSSITPSVVPSAQPSSTNLFGGFETTQNTQPFGQTAQQPFGQAQNQQQIFGQSQQQPFGQTQSQPFGQTQSQPFGQTQTFGSPQMQSQPFSQQSQQFSPRMQSQPFGQTLQPFQQQQSVSPSLSAKSLQPQLISFDPLAPQSQQSSQPFGSTAQQNVFGQSIGQQQPFGQQQQFNQQPQQQQQQLFGSITPQQNFGSPQPTQRPNPFGGPQLSVTPSNPGFQYDSSKSNMTLTQLQQQQQQQQSGQMGMNLGQTSFF